MTTIDRRELLRGSVFAAGGLIALAACGGDGTGAKPTPSPDVTSAASIAELIRARGSTQTFDLFPGGEDYLVGEDNYFAFGMVQRGQGVPLAGVTARVWAFAGVDGTGAQVGPFEGNWHPYAKPDPQPSPTGVNAVTLNFSSSGVWRVYGEIGDASARHYGTAALQVKLAAASSTRRVGEKALASVTPTTENARGVDPICTRKPTACPFHAATLADALKSGKPVAFQVGTPAFCQSRTCGPNIEELIAVSQQTGDSVSYVHSEVFLNDEAETIRRSVVTPTFKQWGLKSEPWLFLIAKDGTIAARFEGPLTAGQITAALQPLA